MDRILAQAVAVPRSGSPSRTSLSWYDNHRTRYGLQQLDVVMTLAPQHSVKERAT